MVKLRHRLRWCIPVRYLHPCSILNGIALPNLLFTSVHDKQCTIDLSLGISGQGRYLTRGVYGRQGSVPYSTTQHSTQYMGRGVRTRCTFPRGWNTLTRPNYPTPHQPPVSLGFSHCERKTSGIYVVYSIEMWLKWIDITWRFCRFHSLIHVRQIVEKSRSAHRVAHEGARQLTLAQAAKSEANEFPVTSSKLCSTLNPMALSPSKLPSPSICTEHDQ